MIKLNGNIYLKESEIEKLLDDVSRKFHTSDQSILPPGVTYLDREFVQALEGEAKLTRIYALYLYGNGDEYISIKKIINTISDRYKKTTDCSEKLYFMQYDLTDAQRRTYRIQYENFLINIFLDECIKQCKNFH